MAQVIFHIGMGKTGTTAIQNALKRNQAELQEQGIVYLGQWLGLLHPDFDGYEGFQRFVDQSQEKISDGARLLASRIGNVPGRCLISNEEYLENFSKLQKFFEILAGESELRLLAYVRSPLTWLPSAVAQWGAVHKKNDGPVMAFGAKARDLMDHYAELVKLRKTFGEAVVVRQYREDTDVVADFAQTLGIDLPGSLNRHQQRPPHAETVLRAAFNNRFQGPVHPSEFNRTLPKLYSTLPSSVSAKLRHLFAYDEIPAIINENLHTISAVEREFGLDLSGPSSSTAEAPETSAVLDELVGHLVDIVCAQAVQIRELSDRISQLEQD